MRARRIPSRGTQPLTTLRFPAGGGKLKQPGRRWGQAEVELSRKPGGEAQEDGGSREGTGGQGEEVPWVRETGTTRRMLVRREELAKFCRIPAPEAAEGSLGPLLPLPPPCPLPLQEADKLPGDLLMRKKLPGASGGGAPPRRGLRVVAPPRRPGKRKKVAALST